MSLSSSNENLLPEFSKVDKIKMAIKKTARIYFEKPLYYLFYSSLAMMMILLAFGQKLSWEFYVMMIILSISQCEKLSEIIKKIKEGKIYAAKKIKGKRDPQSPNDKSSGIQTGHTK